MYSWLSGNCFVKRVSIFSPVTANQPNASVASRNAISTGTRKSNT